jgi:plasmid stability protein
MASITIKGIPDKLHQLLKARAVRNRRSLNAEVIAGLEALLNAPVQDPEALIAEAQALRERVEGHLTQEMIDAYIEEGRRH